jgi:diguanylate cyclase (GGDEF)-like protein
MLLLIATRLTWPAGRDRPHAMSMLVLDSALVASSWLAMIWRQFFWGGQLSFMATDWQVLSAIGLDLFLLSLTLMLVCETVDRGVYAATVSLVFVTAGDVVAALWAETTTGVSAGAALLLAAAWLTSAYATVRARRSKRRVRSGATTDSWRGLVTLAAVLIPMGMTLGGLAATLEVDRTTLVLAGAVVVLFGVRELMRSRQAQGLVDLLADQALHDPLTGLGNRRALAERLIQMSTLTTPVTVLTLDVDRFKLVNTEFGHMIGDDVLAAVGLALKEATAPVGARAFRLGGDEFAVLAVGDNDIGLMLADRVRAAVLRRTNEVPGVANLALTASVGVAPLDRGSADPLAVLGRSAEALRVAKQERNRVRLYTEDLADQNVRRVQMEQRLRKAIDDHAMVFHYQPIVDLRSGRIMGLEALARWEDPELGFVSPTDFVPIAEQTGLIHDLGRMAIESALRVMVNGAVAVSPVGYVAVNVSPLQLRRPQFVQEVSDMVIDLRATPSMLKLEVTEGIFMDTDDPAVENLRRLADLGIGIAIDDFGSGYSSLGYMSRLPVETVKVDRLLTSQVDDARTRSVVKALVWVAEAHGLQVILEGVENEQTAATLRRLGVRWGQGWLFSRAVPESDLPEVLDLLGTVPISHRFSQSNLARLTSPGRQRTRIG